MVDMATVNKYLTLLLLQCRDRVLLGMKKKGFGAGKFNGFGGKIEPGETILEAAVREMQEESGLTVTDATHVGNLLFSFEGSPEALHVYVFRATQYTGEVQETEEMAPAWFDVASPPLERMWLDDAYWLPLVLSGSRIRGTFHFKGHDAIVHHTLHVLGEGEGLGVDADKERLVTEVQGAITS